MENGYDELEDQRVQWHFGDGQTAQQTVHWCCICPCLGFRPVGRNIQSRRDPTSLQKYGQKRLTKTNKVLYPGDAFTDPRNPSYFITAAMGMFGQNSFDSHDWRSIKTGCYSLLSKAANSTSGLVPTGAMSSGTANSRGPTIPSMPHELPGEWRLPIAGTGAELKRLRARMHTWDIPPRGDKKFMSGYNLNGTPIAGTADRTIFPTYIGPLRLRAMVDNASQTWLNCILHQALTFIDNDNYYNQCLKVLSLLLLHRQIAWIFRPRHLKRLLK